MDRKALLEQALADVARRFGVTVRQALGGRLNQHWLVERGAERLVLRCWAQPPAEIDYETRVLAHVAALGWPVAVVVDGPLEWQGEHWSLSPFLDGEPALQDRSPSQQRQLGRLLAELHGEIGRAHV